MARKCTICTHKKHNEIDKLLVQRKLSFREISGRFDLRKSSLYRHYCEHLPFDLIKGNKARESLRKDNLFLELNTMYEKVQKIAEACDRWLSDPDDPDRYDIGPRDSDIDVLYTVKDEEGKPVAQKRDKLNNLLDKLEDGRDMTVTGWHSKFSDPRDLILKATDRAHKFLELYAKMVGELQAEIKVDHYVVILPAKISNKEWNELAKKQRAS